jgi:hypothetical protein
MEEIRPPLHCAHFPLKGNSPRPTILIQYCLLTFLVRFGINGAILINYPYFIFS